MTIDIYDDMVTHNNLTMEYVGLKYGAEHPKELKAFLYHCIMYTYMQYNALLRLHTERFQVENKGVF